MQNRFHAVFTIFVHLTIEESKTYTERGASITTNVLSMMRFSKNKK